MSVADRLAKIQERVNNTTDADWGMRTYEATMDDRQQYRFGDEQKPAVFFGSGMRRADAEFVAHAREDVVTLVGALRSVLEALDNYPIPSKWADPTGQTLTGLEGLEGIIRSRIETALGETT